MAAKALPNLSLTEWAVLAAVADEPTHGFAISRRLAPDGDLGTIWTVRRPLVYRALGVIETLRLIEPVRSESGRGPRRTMLRTTRRGTSAVERWLRTPVPHVRDLRSQLLLQLKLLDQRGDDLRPLAAAQLDHLSPIRVALGDQLDRCTGFDRLLLTWRRESIEAAARFLESIVGPGLAAGD